MELETLDLIYLIGGLVASTTVISGTIVGGLTYLDEVHVKSYFKAKWVQAVTKKEFTASETFRMYREYVGERHANIREDIRSGLTKLLRRA